MRICRWKHGTHKWCAIRKSWMVSSVYVVKIEICYVFSHALPVGIGAASGGWRGWSPPLAIRILMFIFFVFFTNIVSRDRVQCRMSFGITTRRSNTFVIKPGGYEFSRFKKYWSSFFHSCLVCTTIYNKGRVYRALLAWKQARYLNYQQRRLMCS